MKNPKPTTPTTPLMLLILPDLLQLVKNLRTLRKLSNTLDIKDSDEIKTEEYIRLNVNQINRAIVRMVKSIKVIAKAEVVVDLDHEDIQHLINRR